jgi:hypothetical protein
LNWPLELPNGPIVPIEEIRSFAVTNCTPQRCRYGTCWHAKIRWTMLATHSRHGIIVWRRTTASSCTLDPGHMSAYTNDRWPVIVGIVVGSLILFSVVFCIARCLCCAAECTICCCKCCTCCCGSSGNKSGHKRMNSQPTPIYPTYGANAQAANPYGANPYAQAHAAAPPAPLQPVNQQYRSHAAPAFAPAPAPERPQFATFESPSKPVNEDALPAMPSWGDARDRHVEVEEQPVPQNKGDVEMDRLNHNGSMTNGSMTGMAAVGGPRRSPAPTRSPISPIDGYGYNQGFEREPLVGGGPQRSAQPSPSPYGRPYAQQDDYRRGSPAQNLSPVHGAGDGYAQNQSYDRHSPAPPSYNRHDDHEYQSGYAQVSQPYRSPSPPTQNYNAPYDNFASAPAPQERSHTPGYPKSGSPAYQPQEPAAQPVSAYPGQRSYTPQSSYPGQQTYQAFNPGQTGEQFSGVQRKGVDGSYREI